MFAGNMIVNMEVHDTFLLQKICNNHCLPWQSLQMCLNHGSAYIESIWRPSEFGLSIFSASQSRLTVNLPSSDKHPSNFTVPKRIGISANPFSYACSMCMLVKYIVMFCFVHGVIIHPSHNCKQAIYGNDHQNSKLKSFHLISPSRLEKRHKISVRLTLLTLCCRA